MRAVFIAGTDTDIGKTVVTGLLSGFLYKKGFNVITQKWVQTGFLHAHDISIHLKFMNKCLPSGYMKYTCPHIFRFPGSPNFAAGLENKRVSIPKIKHSFCVLKKHFSPVIVEGTGGLMVPLSGRCLSVDLVERFNLPVVLVVGNRLGCINHSLLSISELKKRNIDILGLVFNNCCIENKKILDSNPGIVEKFGKQKILGVLPHKKNIADLRVDFEDIGNRILNVLL
jgi:dethiobiotin synthetase